MSLIYLKYHFKKIKIFIYLFQKSYLRNQEVEYEISYSKF